MQSELPAHGAFPYDVQKAISSEAHEVAPVEEVVPAGQGEQEEEPPLEKVPATHIEINELAQKHPPGHSLKQLPDPAAEKAFTGQGRQLEEPVVEYVPAPHTATTPFTQYDPAGHGEATAVP
jgi:hypothetical protein